jgi:hypothetical protein
MYKYKLWYLMFIYITNPQGIIQSYFCHSIAILLCSLYRKIEGSFMKMFLIEDRLLLMKEFMTKI